ncbi:MAG: hypothetical protein P4L28_00015 [Paludibacteraceae bacterium]|nr:hypothetical protein [Paludibacteraceae bacterium]
MDKQITIIAKQTLPDIAIQGGGSLETLFNVAADNNVSITAVLTPTRKLSVSTVEDTDIATYYDHKQLRPISEYADNEYIFPEGIGFWYVLNDFVVTDDSE